jgi:hypothetical protein
VTLTWEAPCSITLTQSVLLKTIEHDGGTEKAILESPFRGRSALSRCTTGLHPPSRGWLVTSMDKVTSGMELWLVDLRPPKLSWSNL